MDSSQLALGDVALRFAKASHRDLTNVHLARIIGPGDWKDLFRSSTPALAFRGQAPEPEVRMPPGQSEAPRLVGRVYRAL